MSFLDKLSALIPFGKKVETLEYFFALNITHEKLICALWTIEDHHLKILDTASENYTSLDDLTLHTDKLLDAVLGIREIEPQKILFGVPSSWLLDENLKDEYMKALRVLVKELELVPMAYVENSNALVNFLEKADGVPPTAILVGFEAHHLTVTVIRAGKLDGVKIVSRGENSGVDIEKALLAFADVETLPSKILIYGSKVSELKDQLLSYPWMSKLSFLHFPKIEVLQDEVEIKSVCFAGASEINSSILYTETSIKQSFVKTPLVTKASENQVRPEPGLGFMVGDISVHEEKEEKEDESLVKEEELMVSPNSDMSEIEDFERELPAPTESELMSPSSSLGQTKKKFSLRKFLPGKFKNVALLTGIIGVFLIVSGFYLFLPKAEVKIFVEPKILEKDTTVTADPNQKTVDEDAKIIPGQIVQTEVSGSAKDTATGKKQIGDPATGTVKIINNTSQGQSFSKGTILTTSAGLKFTLDTTASVSATLVDADSKSTKTVGVTAREVGADGNLPSGTNLTITGVLTSQIVAKAEGNFSGGTSKEVTVVSSEDQQRLLAKLSSDLRVQAQQKLQDQYQNKKILQEALSENIVKKSYNKNINDQASEFSLNLTVNYKGTLFDDKDLKLIVSKLVTTQVPEGFQLNLEDTETQADVSKLEKDGKLIFLAKFKAKLLPKVDAANVISKIKGKSVADAVNIIKGMDNVLGSEIKITPSLPSILQRLPFLGKNIKIEVGLK